MEKPLIWKIKSESWLGGLISLRSLDETYIIERKADLARENGKSHRKEFVKMLIIKKPESK